MDDNLDNDDTVVDAGSPEEQDSAEEAHAVKESQPVLTAAEPMRPGHTSQPEPVQKEPMKVHVETAMGAEENDVDTVEEPTPAEVPTKAPAKGAKAEAAPRELSEEQMAYPWYVVHTYSGYEQRAKLTLEERVKTAGAYDKFGQIVVPHEKVVELVRGEKKTTSKKVFPGYILVQCLLDDESWHIVKATPKITGFVGDSRNPVPLTKDEVDNLLRQMEGEGQRARPSVQFEQGDSIKVVDGPFADFNGTVDEVKPDKGKLRVLISIFGRNTPVELDFVQVEKV